MRQETKETHTYTHTHNTDNLSSHKPPLHTDPVLFRITSKIKESDLQRFAAKEDGPLELKENLLQALQKTLAKKVWPTGSPGRPTSRKKVKNARKEKKAVIDGGRL